MAEGLKFCKISGGPHHGKFGLFRGDALLIHGGEPLVFVPGDFPASSQLDLPSTVPISASYDTASEAAHARMRETRCTFAEALSQVTREHPELWVNRQKASGQSRQASAGERALDEAVRERMRERGEVYTKALSEVTRRNPRLWEAYSREQMREGSGGRR